ncbi:MAG: LamG-like jellyroll fold domain-containing protein, partial [Candidatus Kryptoniota bacterium]
MFVTYDGIQGPEVYAWLNKATDGSENGEWRLLDHYGPNAAPDCTQSNYHGFWIHSPEYETGVHKLRISAVKRDSGANAKRDTTYTIGYIRPSDVRLLSPSTWTNNGTWWNTHTIHFEWGQSLRAEWYTLRVSTISNPWSDLLPLLEQTFSPNETFFDYTFDRDYPKLYWSVRAGNSAGTTDSGPDVWFGIDTVIPTCQMQNLPSSTYENVFQVNWSGTDDSSGVRAFDIQYRDTNRSEWLDWLSDTPIAKPYELFNGLAGHIYEFRCRAIDQAGNIGVFPIQPDISVKIDPASRPQTAWWDPSYQYKRNLIIQNNMTSLELPAGYPVHLHFDNSTIPTAAEIYNSSLSTPKCNDLRIVSNDTVELNRFVENCSSTAIDIWFRSQVNVLGGSTNNGTHQLYYGNISPSAPMQDSNQIWYPFKESDTTYLYFFQEGTGAVTYDASGNGRNCTIDPSVQWSDSKFGRGLQFFRINNGDSRSLQCGNAILLSSFTIEFWYRSDMTTDVGRIISQIPDFNQGPGGNWIVNDDGKISIVIWTPNGGGSEAKSNFNLRDPQYLGKWVHIAITFNGINEVKFYINGDLDSTKYLNDTGVSTYSVPFEIGSSQGIAQIKGILGTLKISSGVKTSFPYGQFGKITSEPTIAIGALLTPPTAGSADLA